jgi:hypothetical protein
MSPDLWCCGQEFPRPRRRKQIFKVASGNVDPVVKI